MQNSLLRFACLTLLGLASPALAGDLATAEMTDTPLTGGVFDYTITLNNTGTNNLETFWYSWIPGQDYLPASPTDVQSPADWTDNITHAGSNDGYAIQWLTSSSASPAPLTPGASFTFSFDSTVTPAVMAGNSPFYPTTPIGTSFVYSGGPFSDAGFKFDVSTAPEPSALIFFGLGGLSAAAYAARRHRLLGKQAQS